MTKKQTYTTGTSTAKKYIEIDDDNLEFDMLTKYSAKVNVNAYGGGGQANATELTNDMNVVSVVASDGDSVKLPVSKSGYRIWIKNSDAAQSCDVFPNTGAQIDALGADTADPLASGASVVYVGITSGQWYTE